MDSPQRQQDTTAPRISRTRKALIEAGKRLINSGRMDGATIDDIVREADVAKGSFYNHFPDRESLSEHIVSTVKEELQGLITRINEGNEDVPAYFARGMLTSFRYGLSNNIGARVLIHLSGGVADPQHPANQILVSWFEKGMTDGSLKLANLDTGLVLLLGVSDVTLSRLLELQYDRPRARQVMRGSCIAFLRGLGVDSRKVERITDQAMALVIDGELPSLVPPAHKAVRQQAAAAGVANARTNARTNAPTSPPPRGRTARR